MNSKKLFVVSNRLPVCISGEKDATAVTPGSGAFVDSINGYLDNYTTGFSDRCWAGIPGCSPSTWNEAVNQLDESRFRFIPVLVYKEQYHKYYNDFSNAVLWPIFHSLGDPIEFNQDGYENYIQVNEHFAEILIRHCHEDDTVWIYDYHLLLLPDMLRRRIPGLTIGVILHIPFPAFNQYTKLPAKCQENLLKGMLGANLLAFHSVTHISNFVDCVEQVLGIGHKGQLIHLPERSVNTAALPVNSDFHHLKHLESFTFENAEPS